MTDQNNSMKRRVMIDIETLGLNPGSVILSIGAIELGTDQLGDTFYRTISQESCKDAGLTVDKETLDWWRKQDEAASKILEADGDLADALHDFTEWVRSADEVWANSPKFDASMLEAAGEAVDIDMPWEYDQLRDFRTLRSLPVTPEASHNGVKHNALDDAVYQARIASDILRQLHSTTISSENSEDSVMTAEPDKIEEFETDKHGTISLDDKYTDAEVKIAILEVDGGEKEPTQHTLTGEPVTEVVNQKHTDNFDVDIGRANNGENNMNNTPIGEPGWLGNPYPKSEYSRGKCIELFREDFVERVQNDPEFRAAVKNLAGKTLGCYCKPKACHGDIIRGFIETGEIVE